MKLDGAAHEVVDLASPPSRGRGLKRHVPHGDHAVRGVVPYGRAWIETGCRVWCSSVSRVASFTGAWIEMVPTFMTSRTLMSSSMAGGCALGGLVAECVERGRPWRPGSSRPRRPALPLPCGGSLPLAGGLSPGRMAWPGMGNGTKKAPPERGQMGLCGHAEDAHAASGCSRSKASTQSMNVS